MKPDPILCECGCGEMAPIAKATKKRLGHVKGQPVRFVSGHNRRGIAQSRQAIAAISEGMLGNQNARGAIRPPAISKDTATIHEYLIRHFPKADLCERCGREGKTDYAFLHHPQPYTRSRGDYQEMCRSCHVRFDYSTGFRGR